MRLETENLRFLLWRNRELKPEDWERTLTAWLECTQQRAARLLEGTSVFSSAERRKLYEAAEFFFSEEELQYGRLVEREQVDILHENIRFVIGQLQHETQREVADKLGVSQVTLSRWARGRQRPHRSNLVALISYFGLPYETDLEIEALFLWPGPFSDYQKRAWVRRQIDRISPNLLRSIFPAIERLLVEDED